MKRRRAVNMPAAPMQLWEPQPDYVAYPDYEDSALVEMRRALWANCREGIGTGQPSAHGRMYSSRHPDHPIDPAVRSAGKRLREYWTVEEEAEEHRRARRERVRRRRAPVGGDL